MLFVISNNNNKSLLIVDFQKGRPGTFVVKQTVQSDISSLFPPANSRCSIARNLSSSWGLGELTDPLWDPAFPPVN